MKIGDKVTFKEILDTGKYIFFTVDDPNKTLLPHGALHTVNAAMQGACGAKIATAITGMRKTYNVSGLSFTMNHNAICTIVDC